jgi:hypothetical protein
VRNQRLVLALAAVFAAMTMLMVILSAVYRDPVPLFVAAVLGAATYFFWYHATGRIAGGIYERVERQARTDGRGGADPGRGGFGAGPREEWERPGGDRWERVREEARRDRRRGGRTGSNRAPSTTEGPTPREAREVLGVGPGADSEDVKTAYRERVKETHPDTPGGDEEEFKRVARAYERLSE